MGWDTALNSLLHDHIPYQADPASLLRLEQLTAALFRDRET